MIKIITDSTAYLTNQYAKENDIKVVPLSVCFGDEVIAEKEENFDTIYKMIEERNEIPKTSLPSTQAFIDAYEEVIQNGNEAICITLSVALSGTYNNALLARNLCSKPDAITVIDSGASAQLIWGFIEEINSLIKENRSLGEIKTYVNGLKKDSGCMFCPQALEHLKKGGRISLLGSVLGSILQIKPILCFKNGDLKCSKKVIGDHMAVKTLINSIPKNAKKIYIMNVLNAKMYDILLRKVNALFPNVETVESIVGPVMGAHVGPAIGIAYVVEDESLKTKFLKTNDNPLNSMIQSLSPLVANKSKNNQ